MRGMWVQVTATLTALLVSTGCQSGPVGSPSIPGATDEIRVFSDVPYRSG